MSIYLPCRARSNILTYRKFFGASSQNSFIGSYSLQLADIQYRCVDLYAEIPAKQSLLEHCNQLQNSQTRFGLALQLVMELATLIKRQLLYLTSK